ncbi:hypothetical protein JG688_00017878 [Phytophthora aleatoria]|uniref:Pectate lyase n=1 Tax=Phytophthora aleatoria TaxID=2496075 RepID=A0A8J5ID21_9STRA|nr:hypothetical protein JG688_00017878 [Phytophthora aleatoria]
MQHMHARSADEKVVNDYCTVKAGGFYSEDISKLHRSCCMCSGKTKKSCWYQI